VPTCINEKLSTRVSAMAGRVKEARTGTVMPDTASVLMVREARKDVNPFATSPFHVISRCCNTRRSSEESISGRTATCPNISA